MPALKVASLASFAVIADPFATRMALVAVLSQPFPNYI